MGVRDHHSGQRTTLDAHQQGRSSQDRPSARGRGAAGVVSMTPVTPLCGTTTHTCRTSQHQPAHRPTQPQTQRCPSAGMRAHACTAHTNVLRQPERWVHRPDRTRHSMKSAGAGPFAFHDIHATPPRTTRSTTLQSPARPSRQRSTQTRRSALWAPPTCGQEIADLGMTATTPLAPSRAQRCLMSSLKLASASGSQNAASARTWCSCSSASLGEPPAART